MLDNLAILPGLMLNLKPQQKTPDWPEFSPFFLIFPTQSYLFLFFHEMDGDDDTVRFEKEVCTIKKIVALYTEVEQYIACGNEPFQRDVLVVWAGISKRFPILAKIAQDVFSCLCKLHSF